MCDDFVTPVPLGSFPGTVYGATWVTYDDHHPDTAGKGLMMPSRVLSVHDGMLDFHLHSENGLPLGAAALPLLPSGTGQTYGRYSVRFRADPLPGFASAWLLWPDSEQWPSGGEIDFPEGELTSSVNAFMHYANPDGGQDAFPALGSWQGWHTATTEWNPGKVQFFLDGALKATSTTQVPTEPMHWVLQNETAYGAVPAATTAGHLLVDWVVQWSWDGRSGL
jgi:hypothetical protein